MPITAVGLFANQGAADRVVRDLDASDFPSKEVRALAEPLELPVTGVDSFPRTHFEAGLGRELKAIGASDRETKVYVQGVQRGGVLVFATGSAERVNDAAELMNRDGAMEVEELFGREPNTANIVGEEAPALDAGSTQAGRIRQAGGGAQMFAW
jgi:hypothetical protein